MEEKKKFIVPPKKTYNEYSVVSARIPSELLNRLEEVCGKTGRTRNELICMCIDYALANLEIPEDQA